MNHTVVVVTNIPRPYRLALFGVLKGQLAAEGLALRVLYSSDPSRHARRGWPTAAIDDSGVESYVRSFTFRVGYERVVSIPTGIPRGLKERKPVCVVTGGFSVDAVMSAGWCRQARVPRVVWSGAWPGKEGKISRLSC